MKKIFKILLLIVCIIVISGCDISLNQKTRRPLPNLDGMTREEITKTLNDIGFKFSFGIENKMYTNDLEFDQFVKYGNNLKVGDIVDIETYLHVVTTALPLPSENIVDVVMDFEYENKTFLEDGVEEVTLARCIDGDTAHFYTQNGSYIKVRFLGIDTPESTMEEEPWGKAASNFTKELLTNAKTIVIEAEGNTTDAYDRTLAFVWADGILVNLAVVQNGYSNTKLSSTSKYFDAFFETEIVIANTGRRFWGEIDPEYDYDKEEFK